MAEQVSILIVEDEGIVAIGLEEFLLEENYSIAGVADNGQEALDIVKTKPVDLVLLDIHLKGNWDGIETARQINSLVDIPIIYLTAFSDREITERAKQTLPAAYLTKPYQPANLRLAIELALQQFSLRKAPPAKKETESAKTGTPESILSFNDAIFVKQQYKFIKVGLASICYLEANNNHTHIFTADKKYTLRNTLQQVLERLNNTQFIRVHRSYAVNINQVTSFNETLVVVGEEEVPVSKNYKDDFLKNFGTL